MGITVFSVLMVVSLNLVADLVNGWASIVSELEHFGCYLHLIDWRRQWWHDAVRQT